MAKAKRTWRMFLVDQNTAGLFGDYLTEAVVIAPDPAAAIAAVLSLRDEQEGWGLVVLKRRLKVFDLGPEPVLPADYVFRWGNVDGAPKFLAIGTGQDHDEPSTLNDDEEADDAEAGTES